MLLSQNGGWNQYGSLTTREHTLKEGAQCDFGFTESNVSTDQTVHRAFRFHVFFGIQNSLPLVGSFRVGEGFFHLHLPWRIRIEGCLGDLGSSGVKNLKVASDGLNGLFDLGLNLAPFNTTHFTELGRFFSRATVTGKLVELVNRYMETVSTTVLNRNVFTNFTVNIDTGKFYKLTNPVFGMNNEVILAKIV